MDGYLVLAANDGGEETDLCSVILTSPGQPMAGFDLKNARFVRLEAERALWLSMASKETLRETIQSKAIKISGYEPLLFTHQSAVVEKTLECAQFLKVGNQN